MFKYRQQISKLKLFKNQYKFFCSAAYENIKVSTPVQGVGLIQLYRPKAKNALNSALISELNKALDAFDKESNIGCIVIGGDKDYFAAGADIKEMKDKTFTDVYSTSMLDDWHHVNKIR